MVKKLLKKHRMGKLEKRDKKLLELQREIMEYEIEVGKLEIIEMSIHSYKEGKTVLECINSEKVLNYILTPIGKLKEHIRFNSPRLSNSEFDINKQFYEYRANINNTYKEKAEKELNNRISESSRKWAIVAAIAAIIGVVITLLIAIVK